jgi:hypothetical protein
VSLDAGTLNATLGLDTAQFDSKLAGAGRGVGKLNSLAGVASKAVMAGAVAAAVVVVKATKTYESWGESIVQVTKMTGMSTEAASLLAGQWKRFGIDAQSGVLATKFLAKNLDAAQSGTKPMIEAFKRLGVPLKDSTGKLRSISDVLPEVRDHLSQMDSGAERTRLTMQLFGRGGMAMLRWLDATPAKMKAVNKELRDLGMVWGGKQLKTYEDLADAQRDMGLQWTALELDLTQTLMPALQDLMHDLTGLMGAWNGLSDGTQQWALRGLAAVGVIGLIAPKALAAAAALKTLTAASGASAAGSAVSAVGSGAAGASTFGYSMAGGSATAGAGAAVAPVAATATASLATALAAPIAAIIGGAVIGAVTMVSNDARAKTDPIFRAQLRRVSGGRGGELQRFENPQNASSPQRRYKAIIQDAILNLELRGGGNKAINEAMKTITNLRKAAAAKIDFTIDPKKPVASLQALQTNLERLGMSAKQAQQVMEAALGHKITIPKPDMTPLPKATAAAATKAEARFHVLLGRLGQRPKFSSPDTRATMAAIQAVINRMTQLTGSARVANQAVAQALSHGTSGAGGHAVSAAGRYVTSPLLTWVGEAGPEVILPLNNTRRAMQLMRESGMMSRLASAGGVVDSAGVGSGGAASPAPAVTSRTINVHVHVPGGTTLIGTARQVGEIIAPHVGRALDRSDDQAGRRR